MGLAPISGGVDGVFRRNSYYPIDGETSTDIGLTRNNSNLAQHSFYYPRLDRMYGQNDRAGAQDELVHWDPLMIDNSVASAGAVDSGRTISVWAVGEWDKLNNTQRVYSVATTSGVAPLQGTFSTGSNPTFGLEDANPFAVAWGAGEFYPSGPNANLAKEDGAPGGTPDGSTGNIIIFETWGYAIQAGIAVRDAGLTWYTDCLALIDLTDGHSVPFSEPGFRVGFNSSPNAFQNPRYFGDDWTFNHVQFVPDEDSQLAAPKGLLAFSHTVDDILPDGSSPGDRLRCYVRLTEFNPEGLAASPGSPNRVHGRVQLFSRFHVKGGVTPENGGTGINPPLTGTFGSNAAVYYHPPTETWNLYAGGGASSPPDDITQTRFSNAVLFNDLSAPTQENPVETGKTSTFSVSASGDLGEPVANYSVAWTLTAESTFEEALDTSGAGPTVTLANVPLDGELVEIRYNGTLLTETTDYTIVLSTGVITWAGTHSPPDTSGYTATYSHRGEKLSTPNSVLLTSLSKTDVNGKAICRVQCPDDPNLENMVDNLDGSEAAP